MQFKYFRDPTNFAYRVEKETQCSICNKTGKWFDAGGYYGSNEIDCICDTCLGNGELKKLDIKTNEASNGTIEEIETIIYKTPSLPTWQDNVWPYIDAEYCIFEKIASKIDFIDKDEFINSFSDSDKANSDLNWLWNILPEKQIRNLNEGNFNVSVYLFTGNGKKVCTWDAN